MDERDSIRLEMVNYLIQQNFIVTERVRDVMLTIDRSEFWSRIDQ